MTPNPTHATIRMEVSEMKKETPSYAAVVLEVWSEFERLHAYVAAFRREEARADTLGRQVDYLREVMQEIAGDCRPIALYGNGFEVRQRLR